MRQVLFRIPIHTEWFPDGIPIYGFGMMLFVAFLLCTWIGGRRAQRVGIAKEVVQDLAIWLFIGGLLGARIVYLVAEEKPTTVVDFITKLPRIWDGGIVLYGSIMGGLAAYVLAYFLVFRKQGVSTLKLADVIAPAIAVGLALGRLGCFLNGCCYGQVACAECPVYTVTFPLSAPARYALVDAGLQTAAGFTIDDHYGGPGVKVGKVDPGSPATEHLKAGDIIVKADNVEGAYEISAYLASFQNWPRGKTDVTFEVQGQVPFTIAPRTLGLHPTQLYETVSMLLVLLLLLAYEPFKTRDGQVMVLLMLTYAVHRYVNELLRDDPRPGEFERNASYVLFAASVVLALLLWRREAQYRPTWTLANSHG